mgnify:CR=1 FL=1
MISQHPLIVGSSRRGCFVSYQLEREREGEKMRRREYESLYYWKATKGPYLPPLKQQSEAKALSHDDTTLFNKTGLTVMTTASEP